MRRRYRDCQREDGNCAVCSLVSYGHDCHGSKLDLSSITWARMSIGMTQRELADNAGVNISQIQRMESGEADPGNMTARNLLAIADVLGVDPHDLL